MDGGARWLAARHVAVHRDGGVRRDLGRAEVAHGLAAKLLVVGNVGLSTIAGRLLGSVPANVARRSKTDVLIVHTTG